MPGEADNKAGDNKAAGEELQTLKTNLSTLQGELEALKGAKTDLDKKLDDADRELLSPEYLEFLESKKGKSTSKGEPEKVNFDEMTPAQIATHFETKYKGDIKGAADEITKRMDGVEERIGMITAQFDLTITAMKHPDLASALETPIKERDVEQKVLVDTMYKIAKENPTWTSEKCLRSAKLEIKADADEKIEKEQVKAEKERKTLTEKPGASSFTVEGKEPTKDQAADAAWKATFGNKASI